MQQNFFNSGPKVSTPESQKNSHKPLPKLLPKAREMNLKEFYEKRIAKIKELFKSRHLALDQYLTEQDLINFLDNLGGQPFNREVFDHLMEKLTAYPNPSKAHETVFSLQEFVDTHIKAEYLLLVQVEDTNAELSQVTAEIDVLQKQYEKLKKSDKDSSSLQITIVEALCDDDDYRVAPGSGFSVIVLSDSYKYETEEYIIKEDYFEPLWDHTFHIRISGPHQKIRILLRDNRRFATEDNYQDIKCTISLENYQDLKEHDSWFNLYEADGTATKFKIRALITCTFAKSQYIEDTLKKLFDAEEEINESKKNIETSLRDLVHPFAFGMKGAKMGF